MSEKKKDKTYTVAQVEITDLMGLAQKVGQQRVERALILSNNLGELLNIIAEQQEYMKPLSTLYHRKEKIVPVGKKNRKEYEYNVEYFITETEREGKEIFVIVPIIDGLVEDARIISEFGEEAICYRDVISELVSIQSLASRLSALEQNKVIKYLPMIDTLSLSQLIAGAEMKMDEDWEDLQKKRRVDYPSIFAFEKKRIIAMIEEYDLFLVSEKERIRIEGIATEKELKEKNFLELQEMIREAKESEIIGEKTFEDKNLYEKIIHFNKDDLVFVVIKVKDWFFKLKNKLLPEEKINK